MIKKYFDMDNNFFEFFNTETGAYLRSGIIKNGKDTGVDPFMRNFPQLIDIGIMGSCPNGRSGLCAKSGIQCYQNGLNQIEPDMTLEQYKTIIEQIKDKTFQVALGGRGDVNLHKDFEEILKITKEYGIIPNYTTSGLGLTEEQVNITKKYCGACAISEYRNEHTRKAIKMCLNAGIKTNIHYVLGNNTIDEAIDKLKNNGFDEGINAVIFLLHKPIGQGKLDNVLTINDPKVIEFYKLVDNLVGQVPYKIGFDTCNSPAIINFKENIDTMSMDACEAARHSCYITSDMKMLPCSFDNQDLRWAVDLNKSTIEEAWNSDKFNQFRNAFKNSCTSCKDRSDCMGGCPITREIVLCNRSTKKLYNDHGLKIIRL